MGMARASLALITVSIALAAYGPLGGGGPGAGWLWETVWRVGDRSLGLELSFRDMATLEDGSAPPRPDHRFRWSPPSTAASWLDPPPPARAPCAATFHAPMRQDVSVAPPASGTGAPWMGASMTTPAP